MFNTVEITLDSDGFYCFKTTMKLIQNILVCIVNMYW